MQILADATNVIAEGEVLQLMNCHDPDIDEAALSAGDPLKTAKLFEAAARLGAMLGGASTPRSKRRWPTTARISGTAFQLIDDVLDYSGDARQPSARTSATTSPKASRRCR